MIKPNEKIDTGYWYDSEDINFITESMEKEYPDIIDGYEILSARSLQYNGGLINGIDLNKKNKYLIPTNVGNNHWIGVVLECDGNKKLTYTYIDSFPFSLLRNRKKAIEKSLIDAGIKKEDLTFKKHNLGNDKYTQLNRSSCGAMTIENLFKYAAKEKSIPYNKVINLYGLYSNKLRLKHFNHVEKHKDQIYVADLFNEEKTNFSLKTIRDSSKADIKSKLKEAKIKTKELSSAADYTQKKNKIIKSNVANLVTEQDKLIHDKLEAQLELSKIDPDEGKIYRGIGAQVEKHENGFMILEIFANSPALEAGLKDGQVITSITINKETIDLQDLSYLEFRKILAEENVTGIKIEGQAPVEISTGLINKKYRSGYDYEAIKAAKEATTVDKEDQGFVDAVISNIKPKNNVGKTS